MAKSLRWTAWNLTPDGWHRSATVDVPGEATRHRPDGTLLALISTQLVDASDAKPIVSVVFRSADSDAVAAALAKHGGKPAD